MSDLIRASAVELTPEEAEERAGRCFALDQEIKSSLRDGKVALWRAAAALHEFDEESGWTALSYESLSEWLADPEVGMSRSHYYRLLKSYRELVVRRQLPVEEVAELEHSKVDIVIGRIRSGAVKVDEALADVRALGARDLRDKYLGPDRVKVEAETSEGPVPTLEQDDDEDDDVIEGEVVEDDDPAHNPPRTSGLDSLGPLLYKARNALEMPQRLPGARQAVRAALEDLVQGVEALR